MRRLNQLLASARVRLGQFAAKAPERNRMILLFAWTSFLPITFGCATSAPSQSTATIAPTATLAKSAASGTMQQLDHFSSINPDCTANGYPTIRVVTPPSHGTLTFEQGTGYPNFSKENQRYECNKQKLPATLVFYQSSPGYVGPDAATIETIFPTTGFLRTTTFNLTVK